jgi:hypothetical protein
MENNSNNIFGLICLYRKGLDFLAYSLYAGKKKISCISKDAEFYVDYRVQCHEIVCLLRPLTYI